MTGTGAGTGDLNAEPDAAVEEEPDPGIPDAAPPVEPDATPACTNAAAPSESYRHQDDEKWGLGGDGCLGSCHNGQGPTVNVGHKLTIAGRVYNRRTIPNAAYVAGAHIFVIDANGQVLDLVTDTEGKFWYDGEVAFPIKTYASGCPDSIPMVDPSATGNCQEGSGGVCHDASNKIYLTSPLDPPAPL